MRRQFYCFFGKLISRLFTDSYGTLACCPPEACARKDATLQLMTGAVEAPSSRVFFFGLVSSTNQHPKKSITKHPNKNQMCFLFGCLFIGLFGCWLVGSLGCWLVGFWLVGWLVKKARLCLTCFFFICFL